MPCEDRGASTSTDAGGGGGGSSSSVPPMWSAPFSLMQVSGLSDHHNSGCLGASLEDLVQGPITTAIVSNFMIDMGWLLEKAPALKSAEQMLVLHGSPLEDKTMAQLQACQQAGVSARTVLYQPTLPFKYGTHHAKILLLEYGPNGVYPGSLRVIITTANFVPCRMCDSVWWQDSPRASSSSSGAAGDFGEHLGYYFKRTLREVPSQHSAWAATAARLCSDHDFSAARGHLVASAAGTYNPNDFKRWGHMRVRNVLSRTPPGRTGVPGGSGGASSSGRRRSGSRPLQLVLQCSNIAQVDVNSLRQEFGASLLSEPGCGSAGGRALFKGNQIAFVWPTVDQVRNSNGGWSCGVHGTEASVGKLMACVGDNFCRFDGSLGGIMGRGNALPHIKTFARHRFDGRADWVMVGSHNLSKQAWGLLTKFGQMQVHSCELSVLVTPETESAYRAHPHARFRAAPTTGAAVALPPLQPPGQPVVAYDLVPMGAPAAHGGGARACVPLPYTLPPA